MATNTKQPRDLIQTLLTLAKKELPLLEHDLLNASTIYALQDTVKRLHVIVAHLLMHALDERLRDIQALGDGTDLQPAPQPAPAARPAPAPRQIQQPRQVQTLPAPPPSALAVPIIPGLSEPQQPEPSGQRVMEVTLAPGGTKVSIPGAGTVTLPPGVPIPREVIEGEVDLPPGGELAPDAASAIDATHE